jgi:hypothetical protein
MEKPNNEPLLVSRDEAGRLLSLSPRSIDYLISEGRVAARRLGGRVLLEMKEVVRVASADLDRIRPASPAIKGKVNHA